MQSRAVVKANDVVRNVVHGFGMVGVILLPTRFIFKFRKKRSMTALTLLCQAVDAESFRSARISGAVSRPKRNTWLINLVGCPLS